MKLSSVSGVLRHFAAIFFSESVAHALRGSVLVAIILLFLSSSGAWRYFESTVRAHEFQRSAAHTHSIDASRLPLVILIDDAGYERFFDVKSPVSRQRMLELLKTVAAHTSPATRVIVDIDLSPVPGQAAEQARLESFLLREPGKWILPAVRSANPDTAARLSVWRTALCKSGIDFGLPYIPNEFGYPKLTHQYAGAMADAAVKRGSCVDPQQPLVQKPMPLSPLALKSGMVLPFSGDLGELGNFLDALHPAAVVLGGAWGQTDIFATPFGDRFGAQVHAAALAGASADRRLAPHWLEALLSWTFVSVLSTLLVYVTGFFNAHVKDSDAIMVGHAFFALRMKPVLMLALVFIAFLGLSELLAMLQAQSGLWIDDTRLAAYLIVWFFVSMEAGRKVPGRFRDWRSAFRGYIASPLLNEARSVIDSWRRLLTPTVDLPGPQISRRRATFEGACALISLLMQSVLPAISLMLLLYHSVRHAG
jgi:hypothetical protein